MTSTGLEIRYENGITLYKLRDISRRTLDVWTEHYGNLMATLPAGDRYFVLMDVSQENLGFSPYFRSRVQYLIDNYQRVNGCLAIVFNSRFAAKVVQFYMRLQKDKRFEVGFFTEKEKALEWLEQHMQSTSS